MTRVGRKPLAEGHVRGLSASGLAKKRLSIILKSLRGELTVPEASARLDICESRFHAMRHRWLEESVQLLEPRRVGRPPTAAACDPQEVNRLRAEQAELREQLQVSEARRQISDILGGSTRAVKKKKPRRATRP